MYIRREMELPRVRRVKKRPRYLRGAIDKFNQFEATLYGLGIQPGIVIISISNLYIRARRSFNLPSRVSFPSTNYSSARIVTLLTRE